MFLNKKKENMISWDVICWFSAVIAGSGLQLYGWFTARLNVGGCLGNSAHGDAVIVSMEAHALRNAINDGRLN